MAASLGLLNSPSSLLQRPPSASNSCSQTNDSSGSASLSTSFSRLVPIRGALYLGRLQITRRLKLRKRFVVGMAPDVDKLTRRSPLEFPAEWDKPKSPRRRDIFPQLSPMKAPLPPPMPFDPPLEDDEEEEEQQQEQPQKEDEDEDEEQRELEEDGGDGELF